MLITEAKLNKYVAVNSSSSKKVYDFIGFIDPAATFTSARFLIEASDRKELHKIKEGDYVCYPVISVSVAWAFMDKHRPAVDGDVTREQQKKIDAGDALPEYKYAFDEDGTFTGIYADRWTKKGIILERVAMSWRKKVDVDLVRKHAMPMPSCIDVWEDQEVCQIKEARKFQHCSFMYDITTGNGILKDIDDVGTYMGTYGSEVLGTNMFEVSNLADTEVTYDLYGNRLVTGTYVDNMVRYENVASLRVVVCDPVASNPVKVTDYTFKRAEFGFDDCSMLRVNDSLMMVMQGDTILGLLIRDTGKTYMWEWFEKYMTMTIK